MLELDYACVPARLAAPFAPHNRANAQRVAVKHRYRESDICHSEIGDGSPEGCFTDTDADYQAESKYAVHQALTELGLLGELLVKMKRLWVHRQRAEQDVVHLAHRAA